MSAIDFLEELKKTQIGKYAQNWLDEAINALEQEPCEDCVSREKVIKAIDKHTFNTDDGLCLDEDITIILEEIPPVTPAKCIATVRFSKEDMQELLDEKMKDIVAERKKGKWIIIDKTHSKCDRCESVFEIVSVNGESNYCPNCGAEMEGEE